VARPSEPHTILIVEDEVLIRLAAADELRARGFGVLEASNAAEAIAVLQSGVPVDLVFTDVRMPGSMDGVALAQFIRAKRPELKLIITSGAFAGHPETSAMFIRKPYNLDVVVRSVNDLLTNH
jgi:DNA-binding NtrC family response regulator